MNTQLETAARVYISRRDSVSHPAGKFDNAGRWYPADAERCECCNAVRSPSRAFPYSYMTHCRTIAHVANLYGVDVKDLRREVKRLEPDAQPKREGGENYYKAVAVVDGRYLSIFDGVTEYVIGQELKQAARQDHSGGYYVYASVADAQSVSVPDRSKLSDAPRVILRIKAEGTYCRYENKLAFSRITPVEVVNL